MQFAHLLKYWKHDVIPIGLNNTSKETLEMLYKWAEKIILTDYALRVPDEYSSKVKMWDVGGDIYPRPFNLDLHVKAKQILEDNKSWLKVV